MSKWITLAQQPPPLPSPPPPPPPPDIVLWTDAWQAWGQVLGAIGALSALIFLGLQLRSQAKALREQRISSINSYGEVAEQTRLQTRQLDLLTKTNKAILYQGITKDMQAINAIFLEKPRLRRYFYDSVEPPPDSDQQDVIFALCEMFLDFMSSFLNTDYLFTEDERSCWRRYFSDLAESSPALQEWWRQKNEWYEEPVKAVLNPVVFPQR